MCLLGEGCVEGGEGGRDLMLVGIYWIQTDASRDLLDTN